MVVDLFNIYTVPAPAGLKAPHSNDDKQKIQINQNIKTQQTGSSEGFNPWMQNNKNKPSW